MMKRHLSARSIEYLFGIFATASIALGVFFYILNEPSRIVSAQGDHLQSDLDLAMTLYAENCALCHGLAGEGIGSNPALNTIPLSQSDRDVLYKIISRGLYNTSMPAWNISDGGSLSDYQVNQIVTLIQYGDWGETQDRGINLGIAPLIPFETEPDFTILETMSEMENSQILVDGITIYARECVSCHGADGLGTALAPPLNDPIVGGKFPEEIERSILKGVSGTLMASWENSLTDEELEALVALIKGWNQVPEGAIPAPEIAVPVTEESLALGSDLYAANCASCHGPDGQGKPKAPALNVKGFLEETNDAAIQQIITMGVPDTSMPAWGDRMTAAEIQAIVGYVRSWEPTAPEVAEPARGGGSPWWQSGNSQSNPGKGRGGPPWMTDSNTGNQGNQQNLPSGGSSEKKQSLLPQEEKTVNNTGDQLGVDQQTPKINPTEQTSKHGVGETVAFPQHSSSGNMPSRGMNGETQTSRNEKDWRPLLIVGGTLLVGILLVWMAILNLIKLPSTNENGGGI